MGFRTGFLHRKMVLFSGYFGVFLSYLTQALFWVFARIFMRYLSPEAINSARSSALSYGDYQTDSKFSEPKSESEVGYSEFSKDKELRLESFEEGTSTLTHESNLVDSNDSQPETHPKIDCSEIVNDIDNVELEEEEPPKLVFKFQYQTWKCSEESNESYNRSSDVVNTDTASASTSKYEFISGKCFSHILEEPEVSILSVKELFVHSNDGSLENKAINYSGFSSEREKCKGGGVHPEVADNSIERVDEEKAAEKVKAVPSLEAREQPGSGKDQIENPDKNMLAKEISAADNFLSEDDIIGLGTESISTGSNINSLFESQLNGLTGDSFWSDADLGTTSELDASRNHDDENAGLTEDDTDLDEDKMSENLDVGYEPDDFDEEERDIMEELGKLEESQLHNSDTAENAKLSGISFHGNVNSKPEEFGNKEKEAIDCSDESAKPNLQISTTSDLDDSNRFDTLWEHQDLIEQLKMELKKVRATGLPTILEDSESPRIVEDLKPWKIDEKFQHSSTINDLPKFYRSYRERMRKFDILNYQKMYAKGVLQSKDPLQSFSSHRASGPAITSLLSHSFGLHRRKKSDFDPTKKFIRELYSDLEMVYVGQLCLSWEFLQWEYEKALELWESDQYGIRRYNEVAGEFQQFQVLLQRFIENEPFQGPRVENYVRNRCLMRNLLQVPVIREDNAKDKKKHRKRDADDDGITSDMLVEILEESIRTIWRFIRADKDASNLTHKGLRENKVEVHDPGDSELLVEVRAELQKKEKRLREVLRSGSCILKKLHKQKEDGTDEFLYFFSQVDMKLVWRVLNMSRITKDQLTWCRNKLNKINFVNRRIHVEPSFILFPC